MWIVNNRKFFYALSTVVVVGSLVALAVFGLNYGIDFKGGSIMDISYVSEAPSVEMINTLLQEEGIKGASVRPSLSNEFIIRTPHLEEDQHQKIVGVLSGEGKWPLTEKEFNSIGPTLGAELRGKALLSIALVLLAIVIFIAFAFRKVSEPVSSWKYGVIAIVGLIHNIIVPAGVFAILGHYHGVEIDALFVTALLVVMGFSIHDTIVVFDRVRENLRHNVEYRKKEKFEETVGKSVSQTLARSINTSLSALISLVALYFFGSEATRWFTLALIIGIAVGTYSSICLGSPLLVSVEKWSASRNGKSGNGQK